MDYRQVRDSLQTGDVLLFRAGTTLAGKVVGWVSRSPFSHVAIVVRYRGMLCMWEAGRDDLKDVIHDERIAGVHLVKLDDLLADYTHVWEGDFVLRRLEPALDADRQSELERWLPAMSGKPFPELWQIVTDQVGALVNPTKFNRASYACAELIADTYQRLSLLPLDRPSESYSAKDFSRSGGLSLQFGYRLGDEELLTFTAPPAPATPPNAEATSGLNSFLPPNVSAATPGVTADSILFPAKPTV